MAGTTSEREALSALRAGAVAPVYLLLGDDEVGKAPFVEALEALVEPDLRPFNVERFYANEVSLAKVVSAARTLPMLGGRRAILLLRSEAVLKPKGRAHQAADDAEDPRDQGAWAAGRRRRGSRLGRVRGLPLRAVFRDEPRADCRRRAPGGAPPEAPAPAGGGCGVLGPEDVSRGAWTRRGRGTGGCPPAGSPEGGRGRQEKSPTFREINEFFMGEHNPVLLQIPPFVFHGFKCISEEEAMVINCPTEVYDPQNPDEYRLPPHGGEIPYDWTRKDG